MKRLMTILLTGLMVCGLTACGAGSTTKPANPPVSNGADSVLAAEGSTSTQTTAQDGKALVIYFSHSGNTQKIAEQIVTDTGADTFRLEPVEAYSTDYDTVVEVAQQEKSDNARPKFTGSVDNLADYQTVYLGWPCWWGTCPMIVFTFMEQYDLSSKTVIPFTTHGGSGFGSSIEDLKAICPNANWQEGLSIRDSDVENAQGEVESWLKELGQIR